MDYIQHLQGDDGAVCVEHITGGLNGRVVTERASDARPRSVAGVHGVHPELDDTGCCRPHALELRQHSSFRKHTFPNSKSDYNIISRSKYILPVDGKIKTGYKCTTNYRNTSCLCTDKSWREN